MTENTDSRPSHRAYIVTPSAKEGGKGFWNKIGAGWMHRDMKGMSLQLEALPANGQRIEIRAIDWDKPETAPEAPEA